MGCYSKDIRTINNEISEIKKSSQEQQQDVKNMKSVLLTTIDDSRKGKADLGITFDRLLVDINSLKGKIEEYKYSIDVYNQTSKELEDSDKSELEEIKSKITGLEEKILKTLDAMNKEMRVFKKDNKKLYRLVNKIEKERKKLSSPLATTGDFEKANDLYKNGQYEEAIKYFRSYRKKNPKGKYIGTAQYWIGECYFAQKSYEEAISEFQIVVEKHKRNKHVCSAILKQGLAFAELEKNKESELFLKKVLKSCKKNRKVTNLARKKLKEINSKS